MTKSNVSALVSSATRRLNSLAYTISGIAIVWICIGTVADALSRSLGFGSITFVYDINLTMIVIMVFATLGGVQVAGANPEFSLVLSKAPVTVARFGRIVGFAIATAVVSWIAILSTEAAVTAYLNNELRMGIAELPTWPAKAAVALGFIWLAIMLLYQMVTLFRGGNIDPLPEWSSPVDI